MLTLVKTEDAVPIVGIYRGRKNKRPEATVYFTHDLDKALRLGHQIAILKYGVLSQVGRPEEILCNPADDYVEAFVRDVNRARGLSTITNP